MSNRPLKILMVEDNPADTELILRELRRAGYQPDGLRVETEAEYLRHLHAGIDVILSDFQMPEFNGLRALELLKGRGFNIPFILISGTIGEDVAVQAMKQGAADYLLKDRLARLGQAIEHALEQAWLRTEREGMQQQVLLLSGALEAAANAIIITNQQGNTIWVNRAFCALTGYASVEMMGQNPRVLKSSKQEPEFYRQLWGTISSGNVWQGEMINRRKDGSLYDEESTITPIRAANGAISHFISVKQDITERKQGEEQLAAKEALLKQFIWHAPAAIAMLDKDMRYIRTSERWMRDYQLDDRNIIGKSHYEIFPDLPPHWKEIHQRVLAGAVDRCDEAQFPRADGSIEWLQWEVRPWFTAGGEIGGILMFTQIITGRKRSEENQRFVAERLRLAAEAGQVGIWEFDVLTEKLAWDPQMRILYGLPAADNGDLIELSQRLIHPDDREGLLNAFYAALHSQATPLNTEFRIVRANDGCQRMFRSMANVIRNGAGQPQRVIGTNWDVTEERTREKKLSKALAQEKALSEKARAGDRAKGEFLAVMSHEIRTPLNGILGFCELLATTPGLPEESRDYVETITSSGESLLRILNDVLDYSRLEAGHIQIEEVGFAPREILGDIHTLLSPLARDKNLDFGVSVDERIPDNLSGDAGRLRQILLNLTGNAIKFTDAGSITLGLRQIPGASKYEFFVKDTGCGITAVQIGQLFQPFTQADSSISRRHGGTGLGLSISRRLAELLGGTLTVSSEPGKGSEFVLTVTLGDAEMPPEIAEAAQTPDSDFAGRHPLRILVVEDDKVNLKLMLSLIRRLGYEPLAAKNGREALEILHQERPNFVLMDLQMPEMDGIEATQKIRAGEQSSRSTNPVFISALTANIVPADRQRCFDAGMNTFLNKPIKITALRAILTEASDYAAKCP